MKTKVKDKKEIFQTIFNGDGSKFICGKKNFGTLIASNKILDGQFKDGKLHGWGCERTLDPETNLVLNDFIGCFRKGKKDGEGQRFYDNGTYEGTWKNNKKAGLGIMYYNDGRVYFGEWKDDVYDGTGVLVQENGNRYEGTFSKGLKHGIGLFIHRDTGRIQRGIWVNDMCKCSMMQDDEIRPPNYQLKKNFIPELKLQNPSSVVAKNFREVLNLTHRK
ncbi:CLUMA_CG016373, isoform A [Clunio marinus]|uniref:MORN repeat-containing protein 3 n=1 Tax=Clunio marinus TaxID=568069 RepID=A0A1J1IZ04_9DIPT|nr:CLUMA_CG016373, isoform A [Clunio marinus]